jgi:predicted transcriptional regulator
LESEGEKIRKLLRQLAVLRVILLLSLVFALGTTALVLTPSLIQLPTNGALQPPQMSSANATTTTLTSGRGPNPEGGYSVVTGPLTPRLPNYCQVTALISWSVFGAALIWRGHVRSVWGRSRFSYDTFRLLVRMRGAHTRLKLMRSLDSPKNKLQLATALGIDWKAVDKHVQVLEKNAIIKPASTNGTATFYEVTDKGRRLMELLDELGVDPASSA